MLTLFQEIIISLIILLIAYEYLPLIVNFIVTGHLYENPISIQEEV